MENNTDVLIKNVSKKFGSVEAVSNFSLEVPHGSFTTLLGPSGCGKTTLLRLIAGFLAEDAGEIFICGQNQKNIPPEMRTVGLVFQDYALFSHMTVRQNIEYGLKVRHVPPLERKRLVEEMSQTLGLQSTLCRFPHELSGGQQQRVALGRVLVLKPKILLMDEPLSNLDAKLRNTVREELKGLQKSLGLTTIYVTHDQQEALALSDKIAVLHEGRLEQCGTPKEIYETPATKFVADFVGEANFLRDGCGQEFVVRPEWFVLSKEQPESTKIHARCRLVSTSYLGREVLYKLKVCAAESDEAASGGVVFPPEILVAASGHQIEENTTVFAVCAKRGQPLPR